jgi:uncharacterized protein HemX
MDCHYKSGDVIDVSNLGDMSRLKDPNCIIEEGVVLRLQIIEEQQADILLDKKPEVFENSFPKEVPLKMIPQTAQAVEPQPAPVQPAQEAPQAAPVVVAAPQPVQTIETVGEAPIAPFDINAILTSTGGGSSVAIILAILAVVGGGAGWKFYQKFAEQKHEQAMKKLEIEAQSQGLNGTQPPPCQAANATLEAKLTALEGKLASIEKKASSFSADFDAEDLEKRVVKIEKKLKTISAKEV